MTDTVLKTDDDNLVRFIVYSREGHEWEMIAQEPVYGRVNKYGEVSGIQTPAVFCQVN